MWEDSAINNLDVPFESTNYSILEKYYGKIDYKSGFLIFNDGKVLTVHQNTGFVGFPKGSRDTQDKSAYETAIRELFEETGISYDSIQVLPNIFHFHREKCNELMLYFVAKLTKNVNIIIDKNEISDYQWIKLENLSKISKKSTPTTKIISVLQNINMS